MKYPNLMAYIADRNALTTAGAWCKQLHADEAAAEDGLLADIADELAQAQADYAAQQKARGRDGYPYNAVMGEFLGLGLRSNGEPGHGYYMASCVMRHYRLGVARREILELIEQGRELSVVIGRSRKDKTPVRFARFKGDQITLSGGAVALKDGKRKIHLSSNLSAETCLESVAFCMRSGRAYGAHT